MLLTESIWLGNNTRDRFQASLFLSFIVHMFLIFGIVFTQGKQVISHHQTLEITLAKNKKSDDVKQADFFAQNNQAGAGEKDVRVINQTPQLGLIAVNDLPKPTEITSYQTNKPQTKEKLNIVNSQHGQWERKIQQHNPQKNAEEHQARSTLLRNNRSEQIAAISAKIAELQLAQSKAPKHRAVSVATHESRDAAYLDYWRRKIEYVGNVNYPGEARRQSLHGSLRLLVAINSNGHVDDIQVRESSGSKVLDDAAIQIVKLASPFPPLPPAIRKDTDVLEIIRTWEFSDGALSATS